MPASVVKVPQTSPFPLLPLRNGVLFPGTTVTLPMGRRRSLALLSSLPPDSIIGVVAQRDSRVTDPGIADLFSVGTFARVREVTRTGANVRATVEGLSRFELTNLVSTEPFWRAEGRLLIDADITSSEVQPLSSALLDKFAALAVITGNNIEELLNNLRNSQDPVLLADRIVAHLGIGVDKEMEVLQTLDLPTRLRVVIRLIAEAEAVAEVRRKIDAEVRQQFGSGQREAVLREQLRAIRKELGDDKEGGDFDALKEKLTAADLPEAARSVADRELKRFESMNPNSPEHSVIRSYLEWIADLPWNKEASLVDDLDAVAAQLDADHYGLDEVKKRILEHLAVLKMRGSAKGTILCLVGPPGVGKTSLGRSIAKATARPFVRVALGGVRDEAEIRGHRRTYIGALPGRIVHGLKTAGVKNPVFLLDEIDKLGQSWQGSPEGALLEVLDPEQNNTFQDHYMELPFDLSKVLFICTANTIDSISAPLRDRMEIIDISGYTLEEKQHVALKHLLPNKLEEHGLGTDALQISSPIVADIIAGYTREAGVRQLAQQLTKLCRAFALRAARHPEEEAPRWEIQAPDLITHLGKQKFFNDVAERTALAGVATGLAWTPVGGDILFVETSRMHGSGKLEITGQLGDVMKESARAALTFVRSNAQTLGIDPDFLATQDLHIHVPAGAVPKDGPSAGVTIFTALASLLTGRRVRPDTAMTGECTLRGSVLPVGGIKEKVLAAHRAGITRVILPKRNSRDVDEVPEAAREAMTFIFADDMSEVLANALEPISVLPTLGSAINGGETRSAAIAH